MNYRADAYSQHSRDFFGWQDDLAAAARAEQQQIAVERFCPPETIEFSVSVDATGELPAADEETSDDRWRRVQEAFRQMDWKHLGGKTLADIYGEMDSRVNAIKHRERGERYAAIMAAQHEKLDEVVSLYSGEMKG